MLESRAGDTWQLVRSTHKGIRQLTLSRLSGSSLFCKLELAKYAKSIITEVNSWIFRENWVRHLRWRSRKAAWCVLYVSPFATEVLVNFKELITLIKYWLMFLSTHWKAMSCAGLKDQDRGPWVSNLIANNCLRLYFSTSRKCPCWHGQIRCLKKNYKCFQKRARLKIVRKQRSRTCTSYLLIRHFLLA